MINNRDGLERRMIMDALHRAMEVGAGNVMREAEHEAGNQLIRPGDVEWFPREDWIDDVCVSRRGEYIRIVAVKARCEGTGAFSRMVTGIIKAGLVPVVVEPMFGMREILRRWGWRPRRTGSGIESEEDWKPSRHWMAERVKR